MRAIIITDADARALLNSLELENLRGSGHIQRMDPERPPDMNAIHRTFHYVVCRWLQEQGADVIGR